jgi:hypothetical protein
MSSFLINPYAFGGYDPDAADYISRVETADGQALEASVKNLINDLFVGVKADGIFGALKACCIMAGARTLAGALVPLLSSMPAPTNFNFVAGDYNRKTGLAGNGSTKYLNSNRSHSADPQDNFHVALYVHTAGTPSSSTQVYLGTYPLPTDTGSTNIIMVSNLLAFRNRQNSVDYGFTSTATGLIGMSRASSASYLTRASGSNLTFARASQSPGSQNIFIWRDASTAFPFYSNARFSFYSIGESLDLALLDARVSTFMSSLAALSL